MDKKLELIDEELDSINGGRITYTWDGNQGSIGINGNNPFILLNKDAFIEYYNSVQGTMKDSQILSYLLANNIIAKPASDQ